MMKKFNVKFTFLVLCALSSLIAPSVRADKSPCNREAIEILAPEWPQGIPPSFNNFDLFSKMSASIEHIKNSQFLPTLIFGWSAVYPFQMSRYKDGLLIYYKGVGDAINFYEPIAATPEQSSAYIKEIMQQEFQAGHKDSSFGLVSQATSEQLKIIAPELEITKLTDFSEYVYNTKAISELKGSDYSSKRTDVNYFEKNNPDYKFVPMANNKEIQTSSLKFAERWLVDRLSKITDANVRKSMTDEYSVTRKLLAEFDAVRLQGYALLIKGTTQVGFVYGLPRNSKTFVGIALKADADVRGSYQMLHREIARTYGANYEFYNAQDDAGVEPIRKVKLSYRPVEMIETNLISFKK